MRLILLLSIFVGLFASCADEEASLFTLHHGDTLGIDFRNDLHEDLEYNIISYEYMYGGGGVAIEDFNGDSLLDIYFTGTQEPDRLYFNNGNLEFLDVTENSGIGLRKGFTTGVTVADINGDGLQDIYVCKTGKGDPIERRNLLFVNMGSGIFEEQAELYGVGSDHHSNHALFFDYDNDDDLDLFVLNHPIDFANSQRFRIKVNEDGSYSRITSPKTEYDTDQLFRNDGNGVFKEVTEQSGLLNYGYGLSVSVTDINSDGYADLYVANDFLDPDRFYINNGDGTFTDSIEAYFSHISENSMGSIFSDMNNDGLDDLIVLDMVAESNFRQKSLISTMTYERYQTMVKYGYMPQHMRNMFQLQNYDGTFSEIGQLAGISNTDWSWTPLTGDFDLDGLKDLFIANGFRRDLMDCDYALYQSDALRKQNITDVSEYLEKIPSTPLQNYFYKNKNGITFEKVSEKWGSISESFSNGAAMGDLDNDGDLDIVVNNINQSPFVYENSAAQIGTHNHIKISFAECLKNGDSFLGSEVEIVINGERQVRRVYPSMGYFSCSSTEQVFGIGNHSIIDSIIITWPDGEKKYISGINDVNKALVVDRSTMLDYASGKSLSKIEKTYFTSLPLCNVLPERVEVEFDDFRIQALIPHKFSDRGAKVVSGDFDKDGNLDIIVASSFDQEMLYGTLVNGKFRQKTQSSFNLDKKYEETDLALFDVDGDGFLDLYAVSGGFMRQEGVDYYQDRLYINDGKGNFEKRLDLIPVISKSGSCAEVLDFNDDGYLDIFIGSFGVPGSYPTVSSSILLLNSNGKLEDSSNLVNSKLIEYGNVTDAKWNPDKKELIVVGEWMGIVSFKWNGISFDNGTELVPKLNGWWNHISSADLNRDGIDDYIIGNLGLNANFRTAKDEPVEIYAYDFDDNGQIDPIMTKYFGGSRYPIAQRGDLIKQLPYLQKILADYSIYANSKIEDIFEELDKADHKIAHTFKSGVLLSRNGGFIFETLPIEAQFGPIYSILPIDIDKDGDIDLLTAGNQTGANIESGPYDAGRLYGFENNGNGEFLTIAASKLGVNVNREVRDITKIGDTLLISSLNGQLESYQLK